MMGTERKALEETIIELLDKNQYCSFATIEKDKPKVRYMMLLHDGMNIYLATDRKTNKVEEMLHNSNVHVLLGFTGDWSEKFLQVEGTGKVSVDDSLRKRFWDDRFKDWFKGPDDPDYVLLEIEPSLIAVLGIKGQHEVWTKE